MNEFLLNTLDATLRYSTPLIFASMAGLFGERSGVVDIGLEGKMLIAAFISAAAASVFGSPWIGLGAAILASSIFAMVHGFATITHKGNQIVSGVAINIMASGLTMVLGLAWFKQGGQTPALANDERFLSITLQVDDINDAQAFLQEYLSPLGNGLGAITNNGWYNSAKPHRFLGFDATFTLSVLNITDENKSFDPNSITNFSSNNTSTPTILGKGDGATVNYKGEQFKLPNQSTLIPALVLPNFNFGLGVFKKTELNGRFIPNYKYNIGFFGKGEISMWGLGFKHDLLQWIPIIGNAIPMSLSLQAGHTQLNSGLSILDLDVSIDVQATNFNIILSRNILILT